MDEPRREDPAADALGIDALIAQAAREAAIELEAEAAESLRLRAVFEAGATLVVLVPTDLYDPIDGQTIEVPGGTVLTVAEHEGDVLVGRLSDNSHSLGVVYEEPHRWTPRKYFLPLAAVVDEARIRTEAVEQAVSEAPGARGLARFGDDEATEVAVRQIADLLFQDERALLPRGVALCLRHGAIARDPRSGAVVDLAPGTRAVVARAVEDFDVEGDAPEIVVRVDARELALPYDVLAGLDPAGDVLTPREVQVADAAAASRRDLLRAAGGVAAGLAMLGADAAWYLGDPRSRGAASPRVGPRPPPDEALRRRVLSAVVPELAAVVGYFGAGGKYWYELRGRMMDLRAQGCLGSARALAEILGRLAAHSGRLWNVYSGAFHRSVHTHWNEHRHYRTDKDGKRHYTHSTWSKGYSTLWCEPGELVGYHPLVEAWAESDGHRHVRARRLVAEPLFQLLETDPADAERDFALHRHELGFARDAAISALSAAICTLPPAFYDEVVAAIRGRGPAPSGHVRLQKPLLLLAGSVAGIVAAGLHRRRLDARLHANKYELGETLEVQLGRVPNLTLPDAWTEFFGGPDLDVLPNDVAARAESARHIADHAVSFSYTYGSGWDSGRPLDSTWIDATPVAAAFDEAVGSWPRQAQGLRRVVAAPAHRERLLPILRNAVGTEVLEHQISGDESEARGGSWRRGLWFAGPVWGAAVLDAVTKLDRWA